MAPHSSTLAWKIPWMEEPGKLQSMEQTGQCKLLRVGPKLNLVHTLLMDNVEHMISIYK